MSSSRLSIRDSFRGKHLLVTGASGFLGKVWLAMVLDRVPEVGRIYVLLRKKGLRPAHERFEQIIATNYCFKGLHEQYGADLGAFLADRIEVVEGDVSEVDFGLEPEVKARLQQNVDVIVNVAGLVDFNPDIREAIATNVDGATNCVTFTASCQKAKLLHVSTCYVAGNRPGRIAEVLREDYRPDGGSMDPDVEYAEVQAEVERIVASEETPEREAELDALVMERIREKKLNPGNQTLVRNMKARERKERLKRLMADFGSERAARFGWPNTYTWSKSLAEGMLKRRARELGVAFSVFRPAIVECAVSFPFPGWNEGFNTSGPLVYLLGTGFRHLVSKPTLPFDVVPVDLCCNGLTIATAAMLQGTHREVYQSGTSEQNQLTIRRAAELTGLGYRKHYRRFGETTRERLVMSRLDAKNAPQGHLLSNDNVRALARGVKSVAERVAEKAPEFIKGHAERLANAADGTDKQLERVDRILDLFKPFIYDNHWVFETQGLASVDVVEPEFRWEPDAIVWRDYWTEVQMPGLRKWCFPQIEGKDPETYTPKHAFRLPRPGELRDASTGELPRLRLVAEG